MMQYLVPILLGLAHGVADGSVGMQLGSLNGSVPFERIGLLVLLYNLLAFGGQPLVGLVSDWLRAPRGAVLLGLLCHCAALLLSAAMPAGAVALAGIGSAAFHVGGGALALCATRGRAAGPGLFAAPGVVGLAVGGALAVGGQRPLLLFLVPLIAAIVVIAAVRLPALPYAAPEREPIFEDHDLIMLLLLAGIALRSAVWSALQAALAARLDLLLAMAVAAATGKVLGGFLADWIGWRRWTFGALVVAAPLLTLSGENPATLLPGIALLQSATPAALAASGRLLPRRPGLAAGLVLGLAIAAGGLPVAFDLGLRLDRPSALLGCTLAAACACWWALRRVGPSPARTNTSRITPAAGEASSRQRVASASPRSPAVP
jgi:FSR family fosmidomycin resistance protein-like MFS transporter